MSRASRVWVASAALAALGCAHAWGGTDNSAPNADSSSASEKVQEVTVTAQRAKLAKRVATFVSKITGPLFEGGIARWGRPVCPFVSGVPAEYGEFIRKRVSDIARAGGIALAGEKCRPNLYILAAMQPQELLKAMAKRNFTFTFGYSDEPAVPQLGRPVATKAAPPPLVIHEFISTPGPVHVLYRDAPFTPAPSHPMVSTAKVGPITFSGDTWENHSPPWFVFRVFVILDASELKGVTLGQFADYVAMVGLAQIRPADTLADAPTILKLFNGTPQGAPAGITDWDRAFLKSLYATQTSNTQRYWIGKAMVDDLLH